MSDHITYAILRIDIDQNTKDVFKRIQELEKGISVHQVRVVTRDSDFYLGEPSLLFPNHLEN